MNNYLLKSVIPAVFTFAFAAMAKESVLRVPLTNIPKLNPYVGNDLNVNKILNQLARNLVALDDSLAPIPDLSESWSIDHKSNCLDMKLKNNIKFHDGSEITSQEVLTIFKQSFTAKSDLTSQLTDFSSCMVKDDCQSFKIVDMKNFSLCISGKNYELLLRKLAGVEGSIVKIGKNIVGSGPYILNNIEHSSITLKRNESNYHLDKIVFLKASQDEVVKMFNDGNIDLISNSEYNVSDFSASKKQQYSPATFGLVLNIKSGVFKEKSTRLALQSLIDRNKFVKKYTGDVDPAYGLIPKGYVGHIEKSNYTDRKIKKITGKATIALRNKYKNNKAIDYLVSVFSKMGIKLIPIYGQFQNLLDGFRKGEYDIILKGDAPRSYEPSTAFISFISDQFTNISGFKNSELDELYYNYENLTEIDDKIKSLARMEQIISNEAPVVPLFHPVFTTWYSNRVQIKKLKDFSIKFWNFPFYSFSKL